MAGRAAEATVLVAHDGGGRLLGSVTFVARAGPYAEFSGPHEAGMRMLAVAPWAQGRGVGRVLVDECLRRAGTLGRAALVLHTVEVMAPARRLYESMGFRRRPEADRVLSSGARLLAYQRAVAAGPLSSAPGT